MKIKSFLEYHKINEGWFSRDPLNKLKSAIKRGIKKDKKFIKDIEFEKNERESILLVEFCGEIDTVSTSKTRRKSYVNIPHHYDYKCVEFSIYADIYGFFIITDPDDIKTKANSIESVVKYINTKLNSFKIVFDENEREKRESKIKFDREHKD